MDSRMINNNFDTNFVRICGCSLRSKFFSILILCGVAASLTNGSTTVGTPSSRQRPGIDALVERLTPTDQQAHLVAAGSSSVGGLRAGITSTIASNNNNAAASSIAANPPLCTQ